MFNQLIFSDWILCGLVIGYIIYMVHIYIKSVHLDQRQTEEHNKFQKVITIIKLGSVSYFKVIFMLIAPIVLMIAPTIVMYIIGKDLWFSLEISDYFLHQDPVEEIKFSCFMIGVCLAIGIALTALCLGLLIMYRTRRLEKNE